MRSQNLWFCSRVLAAALLLALSALEAGAVDACGGRLPVTGGALGSRSLRPCKPVTPGPVLSTVPSPSVAGPITSGAGRISMSTTAFPLADVGYMESEYFLTGTASSYVNGAPLGSDGRWTAIPASTADYKTRIVVYRPIDPAAFSGTVLVEWLNVSGGLDASPDWLLAHTEMTRKGHAYVAVSAQIIGIEGGGDIGLGDRSLKGLDPERYGSLLHPGDSFSYDMFSQAGAAIRRPDGADPLGGLVVDKMIAIGESQSAFRLTTYVNAIDPVARMYDGYLIHSRGGGSAPLSQEPLVRIEAPTVVRTRTDVRVPVLTFQTETDLIGLAYLPDRQPDSARFRLWEVAGTAHGDSYQLGAGWTDRGTDPNVANLVVTADPIPGVISCGSPINSGPQHWVLKAAIAALVKWVHGGAPPPRSPRLVIENGEIVRDEYGNALGGIRTHQVDAPIASLSGSGQTGSSFCFLFGTTIPFDDATIAELYPTNRDYVLATKNAVDRAQRRGFLLAPDASLIRRAAEASDIGG